MKRRLSWIGVSLHLFMGLSLAVLPAAVCRDAVAAPVAFGFTGTVTEVFDGLGALEDRVTPAMPFVGAYLFDSETRNSAPSGGEGQMGLYHHEKPPAGVFVKVDGMAFASNFFQPDFDITVNNDFGFVGSDDYGFESRNNRWRGLNPEAPVDDSNIRWFTSTAPQQGQVFNSVELPLDPPSLDELGGGLFTIYGQCSQCAGPAAFFRIDGTLTSLFEIPLPGDMNGDGRVDRRDVADVARHLGRADQTPMTGGDLDGDGAVSIADLALLQLGLSTAISPASASPAASAVPEPATILPAIAGLLCAFFLWRRRAFADRQVGADQLYVTGGANGRLT